MANFAISQGRTRKFEGGYANNPSDRGGETYAGIARNFWKSWGGWKQVDAAKKQLGNLDFTKLPNWKKVDALLKSNVELEHSVDAFYKENFWAPIRGDELPQLLANNMYDTAVNSGPERAIKLLQEALKVDVDGDFGPQTMAAVKSLREDILVERFKSERLEFVRAIAKRDPTQNQFLASWESRTKNA